MNWKWLTKTTKQIAFKLEYYVIRKYKIKKKDMHTVQCTDTAFYVFIQNVPIPQTTEQHPSAVKMEGKREKGK